VSSCSTILRPAQEVPAKHLLVKHMEPHESGFRWAVGTVPECSYALHDSIQWCGVQKTAPVDSWRFTLLSTTSARLSSRLRDGRLLAFGGLANACEESVKDCATISCGQPLHAVGLARARGEGVKQSS